MTIWPSGLRRWLKAPFRKGVGSNPTGVSTKARYSHGALETPAGPVTQRYASDSQFHSSALSCSYTCCIRGGDLNNVNASRRVLPHGIGQGIALPCRVGAGSNPAAATYRGATHARGPALDVLKQIIGSHCLWCRRSMSATQAVLKDALAERSKAVAQGAIP